jgi:flagella basal body P-ring formation protein FlgA
VIAWIVKALRPADIIRRDLRNKVKTYFVAIRQKLFGFPEQLLGKTIKKQIVENLSDLKIESAHFLTDCTKHF